MYRSQLASSTCTHPTNGTQRLQRLLLPLACVVLQVLEKVLRPAGGVHAPLAGLWVFLGATASATHARVRCQVCGDGCKGGPGRASSDTCGCAQARGMEHRRQGIAPGPLCDGGWGARPSLCAKPQHEGVHEAPAGPSAAPGATAYGGSWRCVFTTRHAIRMHRQGLLAMAKRAHVCMCV